MQSFEHFPCLGPLILQHGARLPKTSLEPLARVLAQGDAVREVLVHQRHLDFDLLDLRLDGGVGGDDGLMLCCIGQRFDFLVDACHFTFDLFS